MLARLVLSLLLVCAPDALAHTTIKSPATEGVRDDNAIQHRSRLR